MFDFDVRDASVDEIHARTAIYTATPVVARMLDRIGWPHDFNGALLDPSCGDGSFLIEALSRLPLSVNDSRTALRVRGWEIHPGAVGICRQRLVEFFVNRGWGGDLAFSTAAQMVTHADFLTDGPQETKFDVIAGNPPYLRFTHLPEYFRNLYRDKLPLYCQGDLLNAFLHQCVSMMPTDGVISIVSADRWLFNEGCNELRERLGEHVGVDYVGRLDVNSAFYRPKLRRAGTPPRIHPVEVVLRPRATAARQLTAAPVAIDGEKTAPAGPTLDDIAFVHLAPYVGTDGVFTVDTSTAAKLRAAGADLVPLAHPRDADLATDILGPVQRWGIRTSKDVEPTGAVAEHIQANRAKLPDRCKRGSWWMPVESLSGDVSVPCILIPKICRKIRAIDVPAGRLPFDHHLVVRPKPGHTLAEIKAVVLSEQANAWLRLNGARLENDYFQIRTRCFRTMPVELRS